LADATPIAAFSPLKIEKRERDPEMHQTPRCNQWYFGLKADISGATSRGGFLLVVAPRFTCRRGDISAERERKLVHTVVVAAVNAADAPHPTALLHGRETEVDADNGYTGVEKLMELVAVERQINCQTTRASATGPKSRPKAHKTRQ
jgi:transposase, IS5 family